jgi:hypothetical protein
MLPCRRCLVSQPDPVRVPRHRRKLPTSAQGSPASITASDPRPGPVPQRPHRVKCLPDPLRSRHGASERSARNPAERGKQGAAPASLTRAVAVVVADFVAALDEFFTAARSAGPNPRRTVASRRPPRQSALRRPALLLVPRREQCGSGEVRVAGEPCRFAPARLSAAYERTVRGSPKCSKRAVSANQVIAAAASPSSVRTNRPAGLAFPVCASGV